MACWRAPISIPFEETTTVENGSYVIDGAGCTIFSCGTVSNWRDGACSLGLGGAIRDGVGAAICGGGRKRTGGNEFAVEGTRITAGAGAAFGAGGAEAI